MELRQPSCLASLKSQLNPLDSIRSGRCYYSNALSPQIEIGC